MLREHRHRHKRGGLRIMKPQYTTLPADQVFSHQLISRQVPPSAAFVEFLLPNAAKKKFFSGADLNFFSTFSDLNLNRVQMWASRRNNATEDFDTGYRLKLTKFFDYLACLSPAPNSWNIFSATASVFGRTILRLSTISRKPFQGRFVESRIWRGMYFSIFQICSFPLIPSRCRDDRRPGRDASMLLDWRSLK